jgi:hypothetical protein
MVISDTPPMYLHASLIFNARGETPTEPAGPSLDIFFALKGSLISPNYALANFF